MLSQSKPLAIKIIDYGFFFFFGMFDCLHAPFSRNIDGFSGWAGSPSTHNT